LEAVPKNLDKIRHF